MNQHLTVIFDGEVLRPEKPLNLLPNMRYKITIEPDNDGDVPEPSLDQIIETMQEEAKANGMTEEVLIQILDEIKI